MPIISMSGTIPLLTLHCQRPARRRKNDDHAKVFSDGVEAMGNVGVHVNNSPSANCPVLSINFDDACSRDDVVNLIFSMR